MVAPEPIDDDPIVELRGVGKRYRIYRRRHQSVKEMIVRRSRGDWEELWALKDVSFEIPRGQMVGVIGQNGSGKSTLLKVLSRILRPDQGTISIAGRVSSLLELAAGFQPEYTGRENVFLYGALLGLRRKEVERRFEEIAAFSELGGFIEYPVKNYSSGMYMRLGFAVAVHLDPQVLLIDEVLAVGDAAFQKKCYEHLQQLRRAGCTIILVSHDLAAVSRFCERALLLDHGRVIADGPTENTIAFYQEWSTRQASERRLQADGQRPGSGDAIEIVSVRFLDEQGHAKRAFRTGDSLDVEVTYQAERELADLAINVTVFRDDGVRCLDAPSNVGDWSLTARPGLGTAVLHFPNFQLHSGQYDCTVAIYNRLTHVTYDFHERRYPFAMHDPKGGSAVFWVSYDWEVRAAAAVAHDQGD